MNNLPSQYLRKQTAKYNTRQNYTPLKSLMPAIAAFLFLSAAGCQLPFDFRPEEEVKKEVLGKDPGFSANIEERAKSDDEIAALEAEFNDKKKLAEGKINALKEELKAAKEYMTNRVKAIDAQFDPEREELKLKINKLTAELKLKETSLSAVKRAISRLTKLTQAKTGPGETGNEKSAPPDEISSLQTQAGELESAVALLRGEIRLNRLKLKLLKQGS